MKVLADIDVAQKRVFLRADLDVQVSDVGFQASDAVRLLSLKPTIDWLLAHGAKQIIIAGHIDRPEKPDPSLATKNLAGPLEKILSRSISYRAGFDHDGSLSSLGQLILFENLRFWPGEVQNDSEFAQKLASLADVYINDAFGNSHRAHASMVGVPALLPHAAGLHLESEVKELTKILENPQKPFVAIVGGAKIETKLPVIEHLARIADWVVVGGELPIEIAATGGKYSQNVVISTLEENQKDIDQKSIVRIIELVKGAKTVVWNGPMGEFEKGFNAGTLAIANVIIESGAHTVAGGGETTQFLAMNNLLSKFSFVSTGGGAMLEFLAGRELPGIKALE